MMPWWLASSDGLACAVLRRTKPSASIGVVVFMMVPLLAESEALVSIMAVMPSRQAKLAGIVDAEVASP